MTFGDRKVATGRAFPTTSRVRSGNGRHAARTCQASFGGPVGETVLILLAERDSYAAELTEHFLRAEGYEVAVVFSSDDALTAAAERPPTLAIVDLLISGANGQRLCSQLLKRTGAPVIAVSSLTSAEAAYSAGASAFLQKPIEPLELVSTVQKLLETSDPTPEAQ